MTKQEQYQLDFIVYFQQGRAFHLCKHKGSDPQLKDFSYLLHSFDIDYNQIILENIISAENGNPHHRAFHSNEIFDDSIIIIDYPNINIGPHTLPVAEWKELLQEWIDFVEANP